MSWIWYAVLIIIIFYGLNGFRRGLIRTLFSVVSFIVIMILVSIISPYVSKSIQKHTGIEKFITDEVGKNIETKFGDMNGLDINKQMALIDSLAFPEAMKLKLSENNNGEAYKELVVEGFDGYISKYIALAIVNAISYLIAFIVASIILGIIVKVLDIIAKLPVLNGLNRLGGLLVGFGQGVLVIWLLFIVVTIFCNTKIGAVVLNEINKDAMVSFLYEHNYILNIITDIL